MKVIIACAGTGGHINPGIAIANIIKQKEPDSDILFIGTKLGLENELVTKAGYKIVHIRTGKLLRSLKHIGKNLMAVVDTFRGISDAKKIIKEFSPDVVVGTGGYICGPVMLAAKSLKIPYLLHESNAYPGITVKLLSNKASIMMVGFEDAKKRLKNQNNIVVTGNPTKFSETDMFNLDKDECKNDLKLSDDKIGENKKIILVTGGSQGAIKINETVINMICKYHDDGIFVVLASGHKNYENLLNNISIKQKEYNIDLRKYIRVDRYIYNMEKMYKVCDLCITRAGAMTITEHSIASKASILIPLPYATENHQLYNAQVLEKLGAAKVIIESDLSVDNLYTTIKSIFDEKNSYIYMGNNANKAVKKDVNEIIYKSIRDVLKKGDIQ
ncbi:MAG: undecaprenyldiphospho-muramoylpentapeptide beta-N-acetylglucosaminyltransferase [Clostridia bacterium]|nr:undecaprenyldiphospho-muramoylpentapeptide beta-N-acetylglucosaminyltransferase [Clostridia bacterium]